jgi:glycerophosphoryl diester phosphodiesterase
VHRLAGLGTEGGAREGGEVPPAAAPIGFAHRGARLEHGDNTLPGFARALELGAGGLETDAWVTADGVVVLDHDGVVGRGPWRRALRTVSAREVPRLPRIEQLYESGGAGVEVSVDVKDPVAAAGLVAAAGAVGAAGRLWLCSPDLTALTAWRSLDPAVHLVHSTSLPEVAGVRRPYRQLDPAELRSRVASHAARLRRLGVGAVNLHHRAWSPAVVAAVHAADVRAFGWDAQRRQELERSVALGLDGIYCDDVALMVTVLAGSAGLAGTSEGAER